MNFNSVKGGQPRCFYYLNCFIHSFGVTYFKVKTNYLALVAATVAGFGELRDLSLDGAEVARLGL